MKGGRCGTGNVSATLQAAEAAAPGSAPGSSAPGSCTFRPEGLLPLQAPTWPSLNATPCLQWCHQVQQAAISASGTHRRPSSRSNKDSLAHSCVPPHTAPQHAPDRVLDVHAGAGCQLHAAPGLHVHYSSTLSLARIGVSGAIAAAARMANGGWGWFPKQGATGLKLDHFSRAGSRQGTQTSLKRARTAVQPLSVVRPPRHTALSTAADREQATSAWLALRR